MAKILLIEDDTTNRENTAELLELEGYKVFSASDGIVGVEILANQLIDAIICDICMPGMNGLEFLKKMKKEPKYHRIPLIFFSAKSEKSDREAGMALGAYDYIIKPSDFNDLLSSIRSCLHYNKIS